MVLVCIKGSSWQLDEVVGSRVGHGRKIRLDSCLSDGRKVQMFNEKALCRGWSMRPNLSSNI